MVLCHGVFLPWGHLAVAGRVLGRPISGVLPVVDATRHPTGHRAALTAKHDVSSEEAEEPCSRLIPNILSFVLLG